MRLYFLNRLRAHDAVQCQNYQKTITANSTQRANIMDAYNNAHAIMMLIIILLIIILIPMLLLLLLLLLLLTTTTITTIIIINNE